MSRDTPACHTTARPCRATGSYCAVRILLLVIAAVSLCSLPAAHARAANPAAIDVIFANGFESAFTLELPGAVSIRQGGIITLPVAVNGNGFSHGSFGLVAPAALNLSANARLYGDGTDRLGYSFESVSRQSGNLTLYVGRDVAPGDYALTVTGWANGASHAATFTLHVLAKGNVVEIWPSTPGGYQAAVGNLQPGDVLVLHQGSYPGYKTLHASGTRARPITIRGYGHGESKPVLVYNGTSHNHWEIRASHVIVQGLGFDTPNVYSIRIRSLGGNEIDNVSLVNNRFVGCGGGCISANAGEGIWTNIRIVDNLILDAERTPVYIGNHQGTASFHSFLFEGNVIDGRSITANDVVGYGIEVKLNVDNAVIRHNYIVGTRGPGIMIYGLDNNHPDAQRSIVRGNIVINACQSRSLLVGAGPAIVRHNLVMGGGFSGYGISDYGNRHLSDGIRVIGNTAVRNSPWGFWIDPNPASSGMTDLVMFNNLAYAYPSGTGYHHLPADTAANVIHDNHETLATQLIADKLDALSGRIPAPQDLQPIWPMLADGPLQIVALKNLLDTLATLPNRSSDNSPRPCP